MAAHLAPSPPPPPSLFSHASPISRRAMVTARFSCCSDWSRHKRHSLRRGASSRENLDEVFPNKERCWIFLVSFIWFVGEKFGFFVFLIWIDGRLKLCRRRGFPGEGGMMALRLSLLGRRRRTGVLFMIWRNLRCDLVFSFLLNFSALMIDVGVVCLRNGFWESKVAVVLGLCKYD